MLGAGWKGGRVDREVEGKVKRERWWVLGRVWEDGRKGWKGGLVGDGWMDGRVEGSDSGCWVDDGKGGR